VRTLEDMPRPKKANGDGRKRTPVQFPDQWLALVRRCAAKERQPTLWFLLSLVDEWAKANGFDQRPALPWEEDS
jgi:hypothetical protein